MPRPSQAVNLRGYPGVVTGATELDTEAVPTSTVPTHANLIWHLQNILPNLATSGTFDIITRIIFSVFTSCAYLNKPGMYPRLLSPSMACQILANYSGLLDECVIIANGVQWVHYGCERVTVEEIIDGGRG